MCSRGGATRPVSERWVVVGCGAKAVAFASPGLETAGQAEAVPLHSRERLLNKVPKELFQRNPVGFG